MDFLIELKTRNELLFYFGLVNFVLAAIFIVLSQVSQIEVAGANAWFKPTKFALSIGIFCWSIGWFMSYLPQDFLVVAINWTIVLSLGFEIVYIAIQAARGEMSHFNVSNSLYSSLYSLMAIAATLVAFTTLVLAIRFFQMPLPSLPEYYIWAIRLSLILFFIFSMEGYVMGANLSHTIGGEGASKVLPFLNWSRQYGDPRVAHFVGMHGLQIIPILAYYVLKDTKLTIALATVYLFIALYVLVQALYGKPLIKV